MATGDARRRDALVRAPVRRLQRHLNRAVWLQALVMPLWGAVTAFAVWRFVVRFQPLVIGLLFAAAAVVVWVWRAQKNRVSEAEAAVRADRLSNVKGLLLTRLETAVGAWELDLNAKVRAMKLPEQPIRRPLFLTVLALAFLAAVILVPAPPNRTIGPKNAAAANKLAEVEARAEALAKEEPLEGSLEAELARLREELEENRFDAADWEAADGLDTALAQKAAEAAEELRKAEEAAKSLEEAMAKAGEGEGAAREQEALEKALMDLSDGAAQSSEEAMEQALQQAQAGTEEQNSGAEGDEKSGEKSGQNAGEKSGQQQSGEKSGEKAGQQNGQQSGQQSGKGTSRSKLSDLQKALNNRQQQLQKSFGQQGQKMAGEGQGKGQKQSEGQGQGQGEGQGKKHGEGKGQGGTGRGPGEGELSFDDKSAVHPERLAFEPLPQGQGGDPDELWGLKSVNPKKGSESAKAGVGNGEGGTAVGDQSPGKRHEQMLPRNRDLVRRYFGGE